MGKNLMATAQTDLYVSDTIINGVHHRYKQDITPYLAVSGGTNNGVNYTRNGRFWTIRGTASEDSYWILLDSETSIPSYLEIGETYVISLNSNSTGDVVPLRITFYAASGATTIVYPSAIDIEVPSGHVKEHVFVVPSYAIGVKIEFVVEEGKTVDSYLSYDIMSEDNRITEFEYGDSFQVVISGGSGSGALKYSRQNITGSGTINSNGVFTFGSPGTVWVKVYKEGSISGDTIYQQSKTLIIELTLDARRITVSVKSDIVQDIGTPVPTLSQSFYTTSGLLSGDSLIRAPQIYFVYTDIDYKHEGSYPIAARNAKAPNKVGYDQKIKYVSKKLIYTNTTAYRIYLSYDWAQGTLTAGRTSAKPYEEVKFVVTARKGAYYEDGLTDTTTSGTGTSSLYILNSAGTRVPFKRFEAPTKDASGQHLASGVYVVEMPISNIQIHAVFQFVGSSSSTRWTNPYTDVDTYGSGSAAVLFENPDYMEAILFCRYARQYYFGESSTPLMQGYESNQFYRTYTSQVGHVTREHNIRRKDMASVMHRLSHSLSYTYTVGANVVASDPNKYFEEHAAKINSPNARMYTYAGFDPYLNNKPATYTASSGVFPPNLQDMAYIPGTTAAVSDYMAAYANMPDIAWTTWIGALNGYSDFADGANAAATFQEAATILWRYARFRQMDTIGDTSYQYEADDTAAEWAKNGPIKWALYNGLVHDCNTPTMWEDGVRKAGAKINPTSYIDRAEFAYMIMRFCQLYAW